MLPQTPAVVARGTVGPTRRAVLGGALVLVTAAACSDSSSPPAGRAPDVAPNDPDRPVVDTVRAEKVALLRDYDAATAQRPELAKDLDPLRAAHEAHLEALGRPAADTTTPSPTPTGAAQSRVAILRRLAGVEKDAAGRRVSQCRELRSGPVARLVAAIGGAEAAHASLLQDLAGGE